MPELDLAAIQTYIRENIDAEFHTRKAALLKEVSIPDMLTRKNPYLFKAKGYEDPGTFVRGLLDATISSSEETVFGRFLENIIMVICKQLYQVDAKSVGSLLDAGFEKDGKRYLVSIKSGPNWSNSGSMRKMREEFNNARIKLKPGISGMEVVCVIGACYGKRNSHRGDHIRLCGQEFWKFISGSDTLYKDIIDAMAFKGQRDTNGQEYDTKLQDLIKEFEVRFCKNGLIQWDLILEHNAARKPEKLPKKPKSVKSRTVKKPS